MKPIYFIGIVLMLVSFVIGVGLGSTDSIPATLVRWFKPSPPTITSQGPVISDIQALGQLSVIQVAVVDVLQGEGSGHKGFWIVKGTALISVDLALANLEQVDDVAKHAVISVPVPALLSTQVDHEKTKTFDVRKTTWIPWKLGDEGLLRDQAMWHAQKLVEHAANTEEHMSLAKKNCRELINRLFQGINWTIDVQFREASDTMTASAMPSVAG